jgi:hypothetical protein
MNIKRDYLNARASFNDEDAEMLHLSKEFKKDRDKIKKQFKIPRLTPQKDVLVIPLEKDGQTAESVESSWVNNLNNLQQDKFKKEIESLLKKYNLQPNFYDWAQGYILYGKPPFKPLFFWAYELTDYVINSLDKIEQISLTTSEKKQIMGMFKFVMIRKRPDISKKQLREMCRELKFALSKSKKNTRRRSRTFETALKTLEMGKHRTDYDYALNKDVARKTTSTDLATKIFKDETGKKAALVRKQKQRLNERQAKYKKK